MRLTCPTCGATYEIDASVLPPGGRDVQCSNCGSTWFQEPAAARDDPKPQPAPAPASPPAPEPAADTAAQASDAAAAVPSSAPRRKRPDEAVLDVLRQEREHEARARARDEAQEEVLTAPPPAAVPPAVEPDENDDSPEANARRERARVAAAAALARSRKRAANRAGKREVEPEQSLQDADVQTQDAIAAALDHAADDSVELDDHPRDAMGEKRDTVTEQDAQDTAPSSRKSLLPDIEEINSSLRPDERAAEQAAAAEEAVAVAETRSGFRMGFSVVVLFVLATVCRPESVSRRKFGSKTMTVGCSD